MTIKMRKSLLMGGAIAVIAIVITAIVLSGVIEQEEKLVLSNYPKLFEKEVVIVIGENATQIEYEGAEAIAENLHNITGNMPVIKSDIELTEGDKAKCNLILVGGPRTNCVLEEVYEVTDATRITKEYPGENKGILEILRNPWNEKKALLLAGGSDEWGVKAGSVVLTDSEKVRELSGEVMVTEFKLLTEDEMKELAEEKAREFFDREINVMSLEIPLLDGFLEVHETYRVRGYSEGYPYPISHVIAISRDGDIFVLPEDFNQVIQKEHIHVKEEKEALKLAKGYILIRDNEEMKDVTTFLQNVSDIPWKLQPNYAKDPVEYTTIVKPPYIFSKNESYNVKIFTWHQIGGEISEWLFEIKPNGELIVQKNKIADYIGDCGLPTFE